MKFQSKLLSQCEWKVPKVITETVPWQVGNDLLMTNVQNKRNFLFQGNLPPKANKNITMMMLNVYMLPMSSSFCVIIFEYITITVVRVFFTLWLTTCISMYLLWTWWWWVGVRVESWVAGCQRVTSTRVPQSGSQQTLSKEQMLVVIAMDAVCLYCYFLQDPKIQVFNE